MSQEAIDRFAARQMEAAETAAARQHLLACPGCRARLRASPAYPEAARREAEAVAAMEERPGCPEPSIRAAYALASAEALKPERRAAITEHLRRCRTCARDVRALEEICAQALGQVGAPGESRSRGLRRLLELLLRR